MAKSIDNMVMHNMSGLLGDLLVCRRRHGKTIVGKRPKQTGKFTDTQVAVREKFRRASHYAKSVKLDKPSLDYYNKKAAGDHTFYTLALSDYMKAPEIDSIDASGYIGNVGNRIVVKAFDDFQVESVVVTISDANGNVIEESYCTQEPATDSWIYLSTSANPNVPGTKITAKAKDRPGNVTTKEITL